MPTRLIIALVLAAVPVLAAQVPVAEDPSHQVTFTHRELRIMNVNLPPGAMSSEHRHEFDIATVSMTSGTETRQQPSGQAWGPLRLRPLADAAVTEYTGQPASHRVENVGATPYQLFAVENLRAGGYSAGAAVTGRGTKLLTESRAFRIYDIRLDERESQTSHAHTAPTVAILIDGFVMSDAPDAQAKAYAPAAVGLKQLSERGQWLLVPAGDTHHVTRLGLNPARLVEIEVR